MGDDLRIVLSWLGAFVVLACAYVVIYFAFDALRAAIYGWRWEYRYKHRFDKPPTAECYCKDCKWHSVKDNKCSNVTWADRHTPDNGFCYEAEPMTMKEAMKRGKAD